MFVIRDHVRILAPLERCWQLSCSLAVVQRELRMKPVPAEFVTASGERVQARTAGLVAGGDRVRWEGWKFGLPQLHVSLISAFEPQRFFQDTMIQGRFRSFQHDHRFRAEGGETVLEDEIRFSLPLGPLGWIVGRVLLKPYIQATLAKRFRLLKQLAESDEWRQYLDRI